MPDQDFLVDVVVSGAVLGVGLTDPPDGVARVIGIDVAEDRGRAVMRRDYGPVAFFRARRSGSGPRHATGFAVHAHRLAAIEVTEGFVQRYGPFGRHLQFVRLNAGSERLGHRPGKITQEPDVDYRRCRLAESWVFLAVAATSHGRRSTSATSGRSARRTFQRSERPRVSARIVRPSRMGWLICSGSATTGVGAGWTRRQPASSARVNWWMRLLLVTDQLLGNLINAAQWHLDEVQDERLADQLREWIAVKPGLV